MGGLWNEGFLHMGGFFGVLAHHGPQNPPRPDFYRILLDFGWVLGEFRAPRAAQNLIFEPPDAPRISIFHSPFTSIVYLAPRRGGGLFGAATIYIYCLLYTSDAADE